MTTKRTAARAYNENTEQARQHLKRITEGLGAHIVKTVITPAGMYDRQPDWGDVGDIQALNELLAEAARFINDDGEG